MKKITIVLSLILVAMMVGCSTAETLTFNNNWSSGSVGYAETLVYNVAYDDDFVYDSYDYSKSNSAEVVSLNIFGTYTITTKILNVNNESIPEEVKSSPVIEGLSQIIYSNTQLAFTAEYTFEGQKKTYNDVLNTVGYFCSTDSSLAPIYSLIDYDYTLVKLTDSVNIERIKGLDKTIYSTDTYRIVKNQFNPENNELISESDKTFVYEAKSIIDNSALFLAIRNLSLTKDYATYLPTVHPSYGEAQILQVKHFNDYEIKDFSLISNGEKKENLSYTTKVCSYHIDSTNQAGATQLIFLQSGEANGIANRNFMFRYVSPISDYAGYAKLGCLVYDLNQISYTK